MHASSALGSAGLTEIEQSSPPLDATEILRGLASSGTDFVVIGGVATILHGSARAFTKDVDITYDRGNANLKLLGEALVKLGCRLRGPQVTLPFVADERTLDRIEVLTLTTPLGWLDVLARPSGAPPYRTLRRRAERLALEGFTVLVASLEDMIAMKREAGRTRDLADAEELEAIRRVRRGDPPRDSFGVTAADRLQQLSDTGADD